MHTVDPLESDILPFDGRARRGHQLALVFLLAFAAVAIAAYLPQVIAGLPARFWPTTSGTIVSQSIASELVYVRVGRWSNSDITEKRIRVRFAYSVGGVPYVGERIGVVRPYVVANTFDRDRFADGRFVTVHYKASDPHEAVLDPSVPVDAIAWCLVGVGALVWAQRRARKSPMRQAGA